MILDFNGYMINEASLKKLKREVHGVLNMSARKRMRKELRNNIITFKFRKRNGDLRTAHGTLHPDYLPPLKGGGPRPEHQMVYYDLDKEGWRSFRSYSFIKILNIKPVEGTPVTKHVSKPVPKPTTKSEDEEEVKKTSMHTEDEEKMKEKEEKVKEKETKKIHEIDDEIEDDDDRKSVLDDKETPEEEEVIRKDKEKDEEEKKEKDKKQDKEDKSEDE